MTTATFEPYRGRPVIRQDIQITKAGDGLSESLAVAPHPELGMDDEVFIVLKGRVDKEHHERADRKRDDSDELAWKLTIVTEEITIVDQSDIDALLAANRARMDKHKRETSGQQEIPGPDGERVDEFETPAEQALRLHHESGLHLNGPIEGCPPCDEEVRLAAEDADGDAEPGNVTPIRAVTDGSI